LAPILNFARENWVGMEELKIMTNHKGKYYENVDKKIDIARLGMFRSQEFKGIV